MQFAGKSRATAAIAAAIAISACSSDKVVDPVSPASTATPRYSLAGGLYVFNGQLSAITSDATAFGPIQVKFPNDPLRNFVPSPPPISVAISGIVFNPDGNNIGSDAGIYVLNSVGSDTFATLVATIDIALPPNPIRQYDFSITTDLSAELARDMALGTSTYSLRLGNLEAVLVRGGPPI